MTLIHYGEDYYRRSGSDVGVLYHEDGQRSDWGKVNIALEDGVTVTIRPAKKSEHAAMEAHTIKRIAKLKADGWGGPWGPPKGESDNKDSATSSP